MFCVRCGNEVLGNVDPDVDLICGRCCMGASAHVDKHPEEYPTLPKPQKKISLHLKKESTEKVCPCGNAFEPDSRWQKYCELCRDAAKQAVHAGKTAPGEDLNAKMAPWIPPKSR
jgi:hypothetical protein